MSDPKTAKVVVIRDSSEERRRKEEAKQERERKRIAQAEEDRRARMERLEDMRRIAEREAAERHARWLAMERARVNAANEAQRQQREARRKRLVDRARRSESEMEQLSAWVKSLPSDVKSALKLARPHVPPEPKTDDLIEVERWCNDIDTAVRTYRTDVISKARLSAAHLGRSETVATLCAGLASEGRSAEAIMEGTLAALSLRTAGKEQETNSEAERIRQLFNGMDAVLNSRGISDELRRSVHDEFENIHKAVSLPALSETRKRLTGLLTAAAERARDAEAMFDQLEAISSSWPLECGEAAPEPLHRLVSGTGEISEDVVDNWRKEFSRATERWQEEGRRAVEASRAADQKLIATSLQQCLENRGYEVERIDHTLFTERGKVFATKPSWNGHFIEIAGLDSEHIKTRCVRDPGAGVAADPAIDDEFCDDLHAAILELREGGVDLEITGVDHGSPKVGEVNEADASRDFVNSRRKASQPSQTVSLNRNRKRKT